MTKLISHPRKGQPVKIAEGPLEGKYFIVTDYLVNQFQGKHIEKIAKAHPLLVNGIKRRGYAIDDKIVFGRMYPGLEFCCVHDDELKIKLKPVEAVPEEVEIVAKTVTKLEEVKNDPRESSEGNSNDAKPGKPRGNGRRVPSKKGD